MRVQDLIKGLDIVEYAGRADLDLQGMTADSRAVRPGFLFCAVRGSAGDGRTFIPDAVSRGASVILTDDRSFAGGSAACLVVGDVRYALAHISNRFYGEPSKDLVTVGVTGTNGKTTVTHLIREMLERAGRDCGLIGTIGYFIGGKTYAAPNTTPESNVLANLLAQIRDADGKAAVMEVSSHALDQRRADCIDFDVGVFTNLTRDHLDYHRDLQRYFLAKARLFTLLNMSSKSGKTAVVNGDDPYTKALLAFIKTKTITYGTLGNADVRGKNICVRREGTEFDVEIRGKTYHVSSPLVGRFNASNALACIATAVALDIEVPAAIAAIGQCSPPPGRFQFVDAGQQFSIIVDYAHTDDAMKNILTAVREVVTGEIIVVFGCGGDRDRTKRPLMGEAAGLLADLVVITSDNPRSEDPSAIIAEIKRGVRGEEGVRCIVEPDRKAAIRYALGRAQPGDAVVVAGKGHEDYQIIGATVTHFSDVEEVRKYFYEHPPAAQCRRAAGEGA
jgi:UDP-N-acetylmuramoyl-L-alanyl-D-glutamate--2,6-diaminopimelate ligase